MWSVQWTSILFGGISRSKWHGPKVCEDKVPRIFFTDRNRNNKFTSWVIGARNWVYLLWKSTTCRTAFTTPPPTQHLHWIHRRVKWGCCGSLHSAFFKSLRWVNPYTPQWYSAAFTLLSWWDKGVYQGSILFFIMASSQGINVSLHLGMTQVTVTPCMPGLMK